MFTRSGEALLLLVKSSIIDDMLTPVKIPSDLDVSLSHLPRRKAFIACRHVGQLHSAGMQSCTFGGDVNSHPKFETEVGRLYPGDHGASTRSHYLMHDDDPSSQLLRDEGKKQNL